MNKDKRLSSLHTFLDSLKKFKGITRKSALGELLPIFGEKMYDDAGVLEINKTKVVVSADGIVEDLVQDNPRLAGFYSVVVNVNDVVAKGARPLGYVNVLSSSSSDKRRQMAQGIKHGLDKYRLKILKGHVHPDTSYDAIDAAVIGVAKNIVSSTTAKSGDALIVAIDLDGKFGLRGWVRVFDSVLAKPSEQVLSHLESVIKIAEDKLAHASRDISGPGIIGTIGMLCESSQVGAEIYVEEISKPKGVDLPNWLRTYPSIGFVFTTDKPKKCLNLLNQYGLTANTIGRIVSKKTIQISYHGKPETFMSLEKESIFGLRKR